MADSSEILGVAPEIRRHHHRLQPTAAAGRDRHQLCIFFIHKKKGLCMHTYRMTFMNSI